MSNEQQGRRFTNGYDQTTTIMEPIRMPTYEDILSLPENTECLTVWANGDIDCYDVDDAFKEHMRAGMREEGESLTDYAGPAIAVVVRPNRMNPIILDILRMKERQS